jgi:hypothetical protein
MIRGLAGVTALALLAAVGCTGETTAPTAHVQGTVTLNGGPIPPDAQASITFAPAGSTPGVAASAPIVGGKYDVPKAPVGEVQVEFNITQVVGPAADAGDGRSAEVKTKSLVPESLWDGKVIQLTGDQANLDFDLK